MYAKLGYPSVKYFKWIVQRQKIVDCTVMFQDMDIAHAIWVKSIVDLKWKTTRKNPIHIRGDTVILTKELINIQKDVFMTVEILLINLIPLSLCVC